MYSNGIKAFIIESISEKVFLNAKQIIFLVGENFDHNKSDKTVYRHLKDLQKDNIIIKYGEHYKFTASYIEKIQELNNNIQKNIFNIQHSQEILGDLEKKVIKISFNSLIENINFSGNFSRAIKLKEGKVPERCFFFHHWSDIFTNEGRKFLNLSKLYRNYKYTGYICGNTKFDKYTVEFLKNSGLNIKHTNNQKIDENNTDYVILNDYIYSIKYTSKFFKEYEYYLKNCNNGILTKELTNFVNGNIGKHKIIVKLEKNYKKAEKIKNIIKSF